MSAYCYFATDAERSWTGEQRGKGTELFGYGVIASRIGIYHIG